MSLATTQAVTVVSVQHECDDVVVFELADPTGDDLPGWSPGAHIDVLIDDTMTRSYSLCGQPGRDYRIAVRRAAESRGGSQYLHDKVASGSTLSVSLPRNNFELIGADSHLFVAGGIGITPILPMLEHLTAHQRPWRLMYLGRTVTSMAFGNRLVGRYGNRVQLHPSHGAGRISLAKPLDDLTDSTSVYACGPESMLGELEILCAERSLDLHVERFAAQQVDHGTNTAFEVELARSGQTVTVHSDQSLLDALLDADADVISSCEEGTCGTCEVTVLAGTPDHRDSVMSAQDRAANAKMMVCVSRCRGTKLTLDL
jgi:ferredoxin-NADP reductase